MASPDEFDAMEARDFLVGKCERLAARLAAVETENKTLRAERDEARQALREYGVHKYDCKYRGFPETCTCGLARAALAPVAARPETDAR